MKNRGKNTVIHLDYVAYGILFINISEIQALKSPAEAGPFL